MLILNAAIAKEAACSKAFNTNSGDLAADIAIDEANLKAATEKDRFNKRMQTSLLKRRLDHGH